MEATAEFPADLASASTARHFAEDHLASWGAEDLLETTRLLVSELVINVVLHARTAAIVRLHYNGRCLRVEVTDGSHARLVTRVATPSATTGRGLLIVDTLSNRWGVEDLADGKRVWFELDASGAELDLDQPAETAAGPWSTEGTPAVDAPSAGRRP